MGGLGFIIDEKEPPDYNRRWMALNKVPGGISLDPKIMVRFVNIL